MIFHVTHNGPRPYGTTEGEVKLNCVPVAYRKALHGGYIIKFNCGICKATSVEPRGDVEEAPQSRSTGPRRPRRSMALGQLGY